MINNKRIINIFILLFIVTSLLGVIGFTYSYFSLEVEGKPKDMVMNTGDLKLEYLDNTDLSLVNAMPGDSITKKILVKNVGNKKASYNLVWYNLVNAIIDYDLHLDMKCKSYKNYGEGNQEEYGECKSFYKAVPYSETESIKSIKNGLEIDTSITQEYEVTITFLNRPYNQDDNINKIFNGKIEIEEYIDNSPKEIYCNYDGEMVQGAEYVNGQYTYRYKQEFNTSCGSTWVNSSHDGWAVTLTDKESTDAVNSKLCTYINDKPVFTLSGMFKDSKATSLDLSSFNTKNIINMSYMFSNSQATSLDLSSFDTSKVTNMNSMFASSQAKTIKGFENFNTGKLTKAGGMFSWS